MHLVLLKSFQFRGTVTSQVEKHLKNILPVQAESWYDFIYVINVRTSGR